MRCTYCGKYIDEAAADKKALNRPLSDGKAVPEGAKVAYVCPRCGHLIHSDVTPEEVKSLSRAAHAQLQRGRNDFARGMGMVSIGAIALVISIIFYLLARKPSAQYTLVTTCAEFYVFVVLLIISVILLSVGGVFTFLGLKKKREYTSLLKDINNQTFVQ
jgi:hypothetical protein